MLRCQVLEQMYQQEADRRSCSLSWHASASGRARVLSQSAKRSIDLLNLRNTQKSHGFE